MRTREDHRRAEGDPDDGGDRGPRKVLDPEHLPEHDADDQADGAADGSQRLLLALGRQTTAAVPRALEDLLATLPGGGHGPDYSLAPRGEKQPRQARATANAPRRNPHRSVTNRGLPESESRYDAVRARGSGSGVSRASISSRRDSRNGGRMMRVPSSPTGPSTVKPGPSSAISNRTPLGSRK